jgi:acetyl esterase/lipase
MQLVDTITAFAYLVDTLKVSPKNIILSGDSAGGLLALSLVRYLRDELRVTDLPRALVLSSPLADVSFWLGPKIQLDPSPNQDIDFLNIKIVSNNRTHWYGCRNR